MGRAPGPYRVARPLAMSETEQEETDGPIEETGTFQPAIHHGIPVEMGGEHGRGRYGRIGKDGHAPLACPNPRYAATLRGFYRCPACGVKVPLAGQVRARELGYELADTLMEGLADGLRQTWWLAGTVVTDLARAARWAWRKAVSGRGSEPVQAGGEAFDLVRALTLMTMVTARHKAQGGTVSDAKEAVSLAKE